MSRSPYDQQPQRPGDGGGTHDQQVGIRGLFGQHSALPYPKAVLLVDDGKTKPGKLYAFAEDGVVPTTRSASSFRMAARVVRRAAAFMPPVSRATRIPKGQASGSGLRRAGWPEFLSGPAARLIPRSDAGQMAAAATSVLPLPTSPCKRRFMEVSPAMSARISLTARRWAPVGVEIVPVLGMENLAAV